MPPVAWKRCPGMRTNRAQPYRQGTSYTTVFRQYLVVNHMLPGTDLVLKEGVKKLQPWMQVFVIFSWTSRTSRTSRIFSSVFTHGGLPVDRGRRNHMTFFICLFLGKKDIFYQMRQLIQIKTISILYHLFSDILSNVFVF